MQGSPGFFEHHGVWALGVRLFRRIHFKAKASLVSAAFLIPVIALGWSFYNDKAASIEFSAKERLGIAYIRDVMPLIRSAVTHRAAGSAETGSQIETQLKALAATEARLGEGLGTPKQFARVNETRKGMAGAGNRFEADTAFILALQDLLTQANDGSNLILDPDLDTYYLMDNSTTRVPQLIELIARTQASVMGKDAADVPRSLADRLPLIEYHEEQLKSGLGKSTTATPALTASLNSDGPVADLRAFVVLARGVHSAAPFDAAARKAIDSQFALSTRLLDDLDRLIEVRINGMKAVRNITTLIVAISLTAAAYLFYCFFLVTRGGMREVQKHLEVMARGDLTSKPSPWGEDEAAELMGSLLAMRDSISRIVHTVRGSSEQMVQASSEIAAASDDLSSRTEQTASNLEQSAASMEQISATIKHTAENAREAAEVAEANSGVAVRGGQVIGEVVSTMQEIHASSSKISDIIGVIDGIAFQTNILALNAAVEAARAGEQGRGFAVVASEVRALAQRSAQAAKEIKGLISSSVERVQAGTRVVEGAGATMQELVSNAKRMTQLLNEISVAAREESSGVTQVGTAVQELDRVTQQNAALVEQTAASASALKDRAATLAAEVAKFKLA